MATSKSADRIVFIRQCGMGCINYVLRRTTGKLNRLDLVGILLACPVFIFCCLLLTQSNSLPYQLYATSINSTVSCNPPLPPLKLNSRHISPVLINGTRTCPKGKRRPLPNEILKVQDYWQYDHSEDSRIQILVFSAFYDDRPLLEKERWLRVLGLASIKNSTVLHCQVWYDEFSAPYVTPAVIDYTGRRYGYYFSKVNFIQLSFSCRLPSDVPYPTHVSIVTSPCANATTYVPIQRAERQGFKHEFGICVPIAFGHVKPAAFVEWIEMYRLLGVGEFHVYDSNMVNMTETFDYYTSLGLLKVHKIPPPVAPHHLDGVKVASAVSLNDCMMSNMYRYQFIIVVDFDEFIIPKMHHNFTQMLDDIDRKKKKRERQEVYSFNNVFFFKNAPPDLTKPEYLQIARFRSRPKSTKSWALPKSFIDPRSCLSAWNHYCLINLRGSPSSINVDAAIASVQHYRKCGLRKELCFELLTNKTSDDTALRFTDKLQPRVEMVLRNLGVSKT